MNITHDQKNFIKKNYKNLQTAEISLKTGLSEKDVQKYITKKYGKVPEKNDNHEKQISTTSKVVSFRLFFKTHQIHFLFLALLILGIYFNAIGNAFVSDDLDGILKNPNVGSFDFLAANPRSIMLTLPYFLIFRLFGANPIFFRFFNISLHIANTSFIFFIIFKLTGKSRLAFFTSLIFACHPILIESITWISGRPYTQYTFFLLLSFYFYISSTNNKRAYIFSIISFILAVLTSEKAIAFPLIIFLYDFSFGKLKENWRKTSGFFLLLLIGALYFGSQISERLQSVARLSAGAAGSGLNPFFVVTIAISSYLELIFWPNELTIYHSEMTFTQTQFLFRVIVILIYAAITVFYYKKNRLIFFFLCLFVFALSPTMTPLGISWVVAERYVYFGSIGIFFIIAYFINHLSENSKHKVYIYYFFAFLIVILSTRTIIRNEDWKNEDNLWIATSKTSPSSQSTHNNMGDVYARHKDYKNAILEFKKSIEINPRYADAWHNLALSYQNINEKEKAIEAYEQAIKLNPNIWQSYENLTVIYFNDGKFEKAEEIVRKLNQMYPEKLSYYQNLAIIKIRLNQKDEARKLLEKALSIDPKNEETIKLMNSL